MASSLPFEMEDQTDEDFFDKLVDDDDDIGVSSFKATNSEARHLADGHKSFEAVSFANLSKDTAEAKTSVNLSNDSDEAKALGNLSNDSDELEAFANLCISLDGNGVDGLKLKRKNDDGAEIEGMGNQGKDQNVGEKGSSLMSASSFSSDNGFVSNEHGISPNTESELGGSKSPSFSAKEVQWSAFADSSSKGFGSYSDFYSELGEGAAGDLRSESNIRSSDLASKVNGSDQVCSYLGHQGEQISYAGQSVNDQELNSYQYWENLYPGWKYDANSGQWYQVNGHNVKTNGLQNFDNAAVDMQGNFHTNAQSYSAVSGYTSAQASNMPQTAQSFVGNVTQSSTSENASNCNQVSLANGEYPAHIVFDKQYPGWLYDTNEQKWLSAEQYHLSSQLALQAHGLHEQNGFTSISYGCDQSLGCQEQQENWNTALSGCSHSGNNAWRPEVLPGDMAAAHYTGGQKYQTANGSGIYSDDHGAQEKPFGSMETVISYTNAVQANDNSNRVRGLNKFVPDLPHSQQVDMHVNREQIGHVQYPTNYDSKRNVFGVPERYFPNMDQSSYPTFGERSSAGRPPHALVAFGFGGRLIVMKNSMSGSLSHGMKDADGYSVSVANLMEVAMEKNLASGVATGSCCYFNVLRHESFPGPLVGGYVGGKELNKWIDQRIFSCESSNVDYHKSESLKLLLSLLKIAYQHYGKLRSFSTNALMRENDLPESAVANLFAPAKGNIGQLGEYGVGTKCLKNSPSEAQIQATASEVQSLLINGRKGEALQLAQEGQLWEFALILARELGDQFYVDTLRQLAMSRLVIGSPLRTLCLLIAKRPEDVFSSSNTAVAGVSAPAYISEQSDQSIGYNLLDNWKENLAITTANRTENDHCVITHLGDCLWKERNDITAAHVCYLVAGADLDAYSNSARLCLIGADHWNFPRTYVTPEAILRTEFYEYSKVLGNSQFVLSPFQPYKLVYAYMLAEIGRVSDSLKYCQAMYKCLKAGRSSEADTLKQLLSSLEERLRMHQQGGYAVNLAPAKIVGKLLNFFDSTAHRVVGGPPPPIPSTTRSVAHSNRLHNQMHEVSSSQSVMAISSLAPSSSTEFVNQWEADSNHIATGPGASSTRSTMGMPSLAPSSSTEFVNQWEADSNHIATGPGASSTRSTMGMPSLMPSASMEPFSQWAVDDGDNTTMYNRSISEPDIRRTAKQGQVDSSSEATSSRAESKASATRGPSRLSRFSFGAQILQKTVELVMKPRQGRQAKLGEKNKFYYDEKLKKWVEEGAEPAAEETAPLAPPTTASYQNISASYRLQSTPNEGHATDSIPESRHVTPAEPSSGIPLIPPSTNQFSARSRMGVRARYVDTFNKGGASPANNFQLSILPSAKAATISGANFFVPSPVPTNEHASELVSGTGSMQQAAEGGDDTSAVSMSQPLEKKSSPPMMMPRYPSVDSIPIKGMMKSENALSRRTASWSGGQKNSFSAANVLELKPSAEVSVMSPLSTDSSSANMQTGDNLRDYLHEVEF